LKGKRINFDNPLKKFLLKYSSTISLNKNLLISGIAGFIFSVVTAHAIEDMSKDVVLKSAVTVISGFITYKIIFAILFHVDNRRKYTRKLTGKINFRLLRQIVLKMLFASFVFDSVNNIIRFILIVELLKLNQSAVQSATISSLVASLLSYVTINVIVKYIGVFGTKKKNTF
jgi:hypothetical protein